MDFSPSLGKLYSKSSLARHVFEPIFESWVHLFRPPLSTEF